MSSASPNRSSAADLFSVGQYRRGTLNFKLHECNKNANLSSKIYFCPDGLLPFFPPISLSESESEAAFALVFCLRKSSSLSLPFADSEK